MRCLDTHTGEFVDINPEWTNYAILSHTWNEGGEQTYTELREIQKRCCSRGHPPQGGARGLPPFLSSSLEVPSGSTVASVSPANKGRLVPYDDTNIRPARRGSTQDDSATSHAEEPSLHRSLRELWSSILLIFTLLSYLYFGPSPGSSEAAPLSDESRMPQCSIWDDPDLARKIREACRVAREAGYQYLWIDSCCIDKASSSELSEAINSMYDWYGRAEVCYVYLADVSSGEDPYACQSSFRSSRWHRRGWTLQELIAPRAAIFLSKDWESIGSKHALAALVEEITMIPREALLHLESLDEYSVAERLSWAAQRETTRAEDRAYSLLGIFDINMHTLYGEGERAFRRLQEEILRRVPDQSLFAWGNVYADTEAHQDLAQCPLLQAANSITCGISDDVSETALFAPHPEKLTKGGKIRAVSHNDVFRRLRLSHLPVTQYVSTPHGIQMQIPVIPLARCLRHGAVQDSEHTLQSRWYLAILGCEHVDHPGALLGRVCYIPSSESGIDHLYCGFAGPGHLYMHFNLFPLSSATMERCHEDIQLKTVYISHPIRATLQPGTARYEPHEKVNLVLRRKTRDALRTEGYTAELRGPDQEEPTTHWLTLSSDDHIITIVYRQTLDDDSKELTVEAHVTMSRPSLNSSGDVQIVYRSVKWRESVYSAPWGSLLSSREIMLAVAPRKLTVTLGLDWATSSHYFLRVEINSRPLLVTPATSLELAQDEVCRTPGSGGRGVGLQVIGADGKEA